MKTRIDLNCDMGEGMGDDAAMLEIVSTANLACGGHAGDSDTMHGLMSKAGPLGVAIGAHPSFPDRQNFGRQFMALSTQALEREMMEQITAALEAAEKSGHRLTHVKAHGALYNALEEDDTMAEAVAHAIKFCDPTLHMLVLPGRAGQRAAEKFGLMPAREFFADRAYLADGTLAPRALDSAVLHRPGEITNRVLDALETGTIKDIEGRPLSVDFDSICVHGDTEGAVEIARALRSALTGRGINIEPFAQ